MLSSRFVPAFVVFAILPLSNSVGIVSAASAPESPSNAAQVKGISLAVEYRRIRKTTKKYSPEYQAAIERVLAEYRERGGTDAFEQKLRHCLGLSYRKAKQYAKSTEILTANLDKGTDLDLKAMDMLLIARNSRDSKDLDGTIKLMEELAAQYPKTSAGQTAKAELTKLTDRKRMLDIQGANVEQTSRKGFFIALILVAIAVLVAILIRRQVKKRTSVAT